MSEPATRATYLLQSDFERLEEWCRNVRRIFKRPPYLVGSATRRPDYRDVDLRLILADDVFDAEWGDLVRVRLMNRAISTWGQRETSLPIDFQIQRQTEANEQNPEGMRLPMGIRDWSLIPNIRGTAMTQLSLLQMCVVGHLDDKERVATHKAWTALEPEYVDLVCESCARALAAQGWETEGI